MEPLQIEWDDFILRFQKNEIEPRVDLNKGHALMKSAFAPKEWRIAIKFFSVIALLGIPAGIVLFFFIKWWICLIIIITSMFLTKAIRQESAKAVIEHSIKSPTFYRHAVLSETMKVFEI